MAFTHSSNATSQSCVLWCYRCRENGSVPTSFAIRPPPISFRRASISIRSVLGSDTCRSIPPTSTPRLTLLRKSEHWRHWRVGEHDGRLEAGPASQMSWLSCARCSLANMWRTSRRFGEGSTSICLCATYGGTPHNSLYVAGHIKRTVGAHRLPRRTAASTDIRGRQELERCR